MKNEFEPSAPIGLLTDIIEHAPIRIFWKDREGRYLGCNTLFATDAGLAHPQQLIGKTDLDLGWKAQAGMYRADDAKVMDSGEAKLGYEEPQTTPDGNTIWLRTSKVPLKDGRQNVIGILGIYEDITNFKQAEQRLAASEHTYRGIFNALNEAVYILDEQGCFLDVNEGAERMSGYPRDYFVGKTPAALSAPGYNDMSDVVEKHGLAFNGTPQSIEFWAFRSSGEVFPKEVHLYPGEYFGRRVVLAVATDITARKQAEEALRNSELRLKQAQVIGEVGVWDWNPVTGALVWSEETYNILGYAMGEVEPGYELFLSHVHPDDRGMLGRAVESALHHGSKYNIDCRFIRVDGSECVANAQGQVSYDSSGNPVRMLGTFQNITSRKQVENRLREALSLQAATLEATADGILVVSSAGEWTAYNRKFVDMWHLPEEILASGDDQQALNYVLQQLIDPQAFLDRVMSLYAHPGETSFDVLQFRDGRIIERYSMVQRIEGVIAGRVWSFRDVTERKMFEDQLRQAQKMEAIGTLVGGIAHDFNNMLAAIQGNVFLARMHLQGQPEAGEKIDRIEQLGNRAAEMVRQLLTFARKDRVSMLVFSLNSFLNEGYKLIRALIPENIDHSNLICREELKVHGDATQLQQVLMNLMNNAVDAVAGIDQPAIRCRLDAYGPDEAFCLRHPDLEADRFACLSVQDNGCGIDPEDLDKIFEPFFTTKGIGKGTGLGLSMLYGAVQTHGGAVEVESRPGRGSTFRVYLPLCVVETSAEAGKQAQAENGQGETILLVDDQRDLRFTAAQVLEVLGYRVLQAGTGREALRIFREQQGRIDLILSDVVMPDMGGVELLQAIRSDGGQVPFILATGYDIQHTLNESAIGVDCEMISKPFDFNELSRIIPLMIHSQ